MIHVLVVDDEKEQNQVICTYLMKNNIHAVGCTSATQAYDVLFEGHFDLIIFDIMMPEIDDYEFAESIRRIDKNGGELVVVCNFVPVERKGYRIGAPTPGIYEEVFSSDRAAYGGSGITNGDTIKTTAVPMHGCEESMELDLPPMSVLYLRCRRKKPQRRKISAAQAQPAPKQARPAKEAKPAKEKEPARQTKAAAKEAKPAGESTAKKPARGRKKKTDDA